MSRLYQVLMSNELHVDLTLTLNESLILSHKIEVLCLGLHAFVCNLSENLELVNCIKEIKFIFI